MRENEFSICQENNGGKRISVLSRQKRFTPLFRFKQKPCQVDSIMQGSCQRLLGTLFAIAGIVPGFLHARVMPNWVSDKIISIRYSPPLK